jgi:putative transposase
LNEAEQAGNIREVCKLNNFTEQTFYRWRTKFGGMEVSEAKRLKELERENSELKNMVAEQALDIRMLKDLNSKKWWACRSNGAEQSTLRQSMAWANAVLARWSGFGEVRSVVRQAGSKKQNSFVEITSWPSGIRDMAIGRSIRFYSPKESRSAEIDCDSFGSVKACKCRRSNVSGVAAARARQTKIGLSVLTTSGVTTSSLIKRSMAGSFAFWPWSTSSLAKQSGSSALDSHDVIRVFNQLVEIRSHPRIIKSDDGPEFVAEKIQDWIKTRPTGTFFIEPGSPWQNGHNESFNGVLRDSCLNRWAFLSVREARRVVESWRQEYNEERPHGALNQIAPAADAAGLEQEHRKAAWCSCQIPTMGLDAFRWACHFARRLKREHRGYGDTSSVEEVFVKVNGE